MIQTNEQQEGERKPEAAGKRAMDSMVEDVRDNDEGAWMEAVKRKTLMRIRIETMTGMGFVHCQFIEHQH